MSIRKYNQNKILRISSSQIESVERQYWARYNNEMLESSLLHKLNTNKVG
jgi:hypothetical protein